MVLAWACVPSRAVGWPCAPAKLTFPQVCSSLVNPCSPGLGLCTVTPSRLAMCVSPAVCPSVTFKLCDVWSWPSPLYRHAPEGWPAQVLATVPEEHSSYGMCGPGLFLCTVTPRRAVDLHKSSRLFSRVHSSYVMCGRGFVLYTVTPPRVGMHKSSRLFQRTFKLCDVFTVFK